MTNAQPVPPPIQAFWYNVTKAGEVKYGPTVVGNMIQISRNENGAV